MANILELKNIKKSYGENEVLHGLSFSLEEGSFTSIIGQSGSGKSTLLNILGTLDYPNSGELIIDGIAAEKLKGKKLAKLRNNTLGFIFQFHHLLPEFTALENILMPVKIQKGKVTKEDLEWAEELIEVVGLSKVKNNNALKMSGGQQQRTAIARALTNKPKLILADEPTGNLDSDTAENIYQLMRSINEKYNTSFLIITHDQAIAQKADRIIEIKDGHIVLDVSK
jgi:lipoprotein-releasing system ATP-binding protein